MMMHEQGREIDLLKQERQNNERRLRYNISMALSEQAIKC